METVDNCSVSDNRVPVVCPTIGRLPYVQNTFCSVEDEMMLVVLWTLIKMQHSSIHLRLLIIVKRYNISYRALNATFNEKKIDRRLFFICIYVTYMIKTLYNINI